MRFGLAVRDITPPFPTPMAGYAVRRDLFDSVNDPLALTAVLLDEGGRRALLCSADLCSFPRDGRIQEWIERLGEAAGAPPESVMLCASHTHGGPSVPSAVESFSDNRFREQTLRYCDSLFEQAVGAATEAAANLEEGTLWTGEGKTSLPMNRRPDRDGDVPNAPNPGGPVDDRLTVFVLRKASGEPAVVGMRASCHPVATGAQHRITADYVGAWRAAFRAAFGSGVAPFFLQGAGGDARPRHAQEGDKWRAVPHDQLPGMGRELLAECLPVLMGELRPVGPLLLEGAVEHVRAPLEKKHTTRQDFEELQKSDAEYVREYAAEGLRLLEQGESLPDFAPYRVQTLWLDENLALIGLDGEPLCGLAAHVEAAAGPGKGLVIGYVNGSQGYLPDTAELARGGYEAKSYLYKRWSGPWKPGLEERLAEGVARR